MINDFDTFITITYKSGLFETEEKAKKALKLAKKRIIKKHKREKITGEGIIKTSNGVSISKTEYYYFEINSYKNLIFMEE